MLISSQTEPVPFSGMSYNDNRSERSQQTNTSSLVPPTLVPKYFNVPYAVQNGYFRCVRYLLELSYDPNERDSQLRTPLILCSYVENDRWSLSLAQNLLEKGAKIALEDHARRNAMHHACALQRIHLVQLYLSCLDFNIESKDCEGNTCLHYVAITGNCEIAELLIKTAEKMNIRLDQYLNRQGCSAAVLALRYGHIECANQITHRDWDEFFVIPRPLSIYETPPTPDGNHSPMAITTTTSKKKKKSNFHQPPTVKNDIRPSTLSFGLLKIIFNECDSSYSTRLAGLCNEKKSTRRRLRQKKQDGPRSILPPQSAHYCSTEGFIHELEISALDKEPKLKSDDNDEGTPIIRTSPRMDLLMQQRLLTDDRSNSTLNYIEPAISVLYESPRMKSQLQQRPKTAAVPRNLTSANAVGIPSRLSSPKISRKISSTTTRPSSASVVPRQRYTNLSSEATTYSQTLYNGRPLSAVLHSHYRNPPAQRTIDSSCTIREAKGAANRYNKPEELFGLKPEELFGLKPEELFGLKPEELVRQTNHQPKIINRRKTMDHTRSYHHTYNWQDDVDKLVDLYNIHHSANYRKTVIPPPSTAVHSDATTDLLHTGKARRLSLTKHSPNFFRSRSPAHPKQSTLASLHIPRRNSISQRPSIKLTNA